MNSTFPTELLFPLHSVYANCLLANLNVRESLGRTEKGTLSLNLSALRDPTISAIVYREAAVRNHLFHNYVAGADVL
jgi:hypothetical protein